MNLAALEVAIGRKYTEVKTIPKGDHDDFYYSVWLKVEQQSFCVTPILLDTREEAVWTQRQLSIALAKLMTRVLRDVEELE